MPHSSPATMGFQSVLFIRERQFKMSQSLMVDAYSQSGSERIRELANVCSLALKNS